MRTELHERAAAIADDIQAELQRLGRWSDVAVAPERLVDMGAFGTRTLAAEEWIQSVLLPNIRALVATGAPLPAHSATAVWATREFDGDPEVGRLLALLGRLDALVERPALAPAALVAAVASGDQEAVAQLLAAGADPCAATDDGLTPLHVAAAGGHPALATLLAAPFAVDLATLARAPHPDGPYAAIAASLVAAGADPNARGGPGLLTPLMVATYFARPDVAAALQAAGADPALRDAWGRSAERLAVFPTIARLIGLCARLPMVRAAYLAQVHTPALHQYTTPLVGLELSASLPADAFAGWPADDPIVAFALADDAVSRLVRLGPPVYTATPDPP